MRELYRQQFAVSVGTSSTQLLGPNDKRIGLLISAPQANRMTISFGQPAVSGAGVVLYPLQSPLELLYEHYGQAVREEVNAIIDTAGETIGGLQVMEVDCECLGDRGKLIPPNAGQQSMTQSATQK